MPASGNQAPVFKKIVVGHLCAHGPCGQRRACSDVQLNQQQAFTCSGACVWDGRARRRQERPLQLGSARQRPHDLRRCGQAVALKGKRLVVHFGTSGPVGVRDGAHRSHCILWCAAWGNSLFGRRRAPRRCVGVMSVLLDVQCFSCPSSICLLSYRSVVKAPNHLYCNGIACDLPGACTQELYMENRVPVLASVGKALGWSRLQRTRLFNARTGNFNS